MKRSVRRSALLIGVVACLSVGMGIGGLGCGDDDGDSSSDAGSNASADAGESQDAGAGSDGALAQDASTQDGGPACGQLLVDTVDSPSVVTPPLGAAPSPGVTFVIPETGVQVTRISDVGDPQATATGYTNGYSRWSPANRTGEYVTAFGTNGGAVVYRLADRTIVRALNVGESAELHWDSSGQPGTETLVYYRVGAELRRMDVLVGDEELVHDFAADAPTAQVAINGVEGAPSVDMRYWAFQLCEGMSGGGQCEGLIDIVVYDLVDDVLVGRLSDVESSIPTPNFVDMSPSGSRIVVGSCKEDGSTPAPWNGPYAWSRDFSTRVRMGTNCTHSGWGWGGGGEELYVSFDSCGASNEEITPTCDYVMAVDVNDAQGWENRFGILYKGDLGWGASLHIGRIYDNAVRGWFFLSTYGSGGTGWDHQLFFAELVPESAGPRMWRLSHTMTSDDGYWTEAFASLDFAAGHVYWGANWNGTSNLELYRATLCDRWWEALGTP